VIRFALHFLYDEDYPLRTDMTLHGDFLSPGRYALPPGVTAEVIPYLGEFRMTRIEFSFPDDESARGWFFGRYCDGFEAEERDYRIVRSLYDPEFAPRKKKLLKKI
jgi:hypothetical protein